MAHIITFSTEREPHVISFTVLETGPHRIQFSVVRSPHTITFSIEPIDSHVIKFKVVGPKHVIQFYVVPDLVQGIEDDEIEEIEFQWERTYIEEKRKEAFEYVDQMVLSELSVNKVQLARGKDAFCSAEQLIIITAAIDYLSIIKVNMLYAEQYGIQVTAEDWAKKYCFKHIKKAIGACYNINFQKLMDIFEVNVYTPEDQLEPGGDSIVTDGIFQVQFNEIFA